MTNEQENYRNKAILRERLTALTVEILGPDPHTGDAPHQDTVDALCEGYIDRCALSNSRPPGYAHEPWRGQGAMCHARHAFFHVLRVILSLPFGTHWISDLGQPELSHAAMRLDFLAWSHKRGVK